jgi:Ca2+-transporting ATPase
VEQARTVAFTVMMVAQLMHAFNCRSERLSLFQVGLGTNRSLLWAVLLSLAMQFAVLTIPAVSSIFKVAPLPAATWGLMAAMALLPLIIVEAAKWLRRLRT